MADASKQLVFEAHLGDLERLVNLNVSRTFQDRSIKDQLDVAVWAKAEMLLECTVHTSETSTINDIERLVELRSISMQYYKRKLDEVVPEDPSYHSYESLVDQVLQRKVAFLADTEPLKDSLDPIDGLDRLLIIEAAIRKHDERYRVSEDPLPTKMVQVIKQKMRVLADRTAWPNFIPHQDTSGCDSASADRSISKYSSHTTDPCSLMEVVAKLEKETRALKDQCASVERIAADACCHKEVAMEELIQKVSSLESEKATLATQLTKANDTLDQIGKSLRPHVLTLDTTTAGSLTSIENSRVGSLTPISTTISLHDEPGYFSAKDNRAATTYTTSPTAASQPRDITKKGKSGIRPRSLYEMLGDSDYDAGEPMNDFPSSSTFEKKKKKPQQATKAGKNRKADHPVNV